MIIKGKSRSDPSDLAAHLLNAEMNERVQVLEVSGTVAKDLRGAFGEMDAWALGTKCSKPLYHANISPMTDARLTPDQLNEAINALEKKLGLEGHARAVVCHEKHSREHFHIVWSRIDTDQMRAVPDSHNYRKHEEVSRDLERQFGHERVQGAHHERDGVQRPARTPSRAELRQEERTGIKSKDVRAEVTEAFKASDNGGAFKAALEDRGYILAKGDRRDFIVVDHAGGIHSLARRIEGVNAAELREFMKPVARDSLPSADQAKELQADREAGYQSPLDALKWEDSLAASAIEKAKKDDAQKKELEKAKREARKDDLVEKGYASGEDYVHQTKAAQRDIKRRTKLRGPQAMHPDDHEQRSVRGKFSKEADIATTPQEKLDQEPQDLAVGDLTERHDHNQDAEIRHRSTDKIVYGENGHAGSEQARKGREEAERQKRERDETAAKDFMQDKPVSKREAAAPERERTDAFHERMRRLLADDTGKERGDDDPDRQREAPGGGRTRSR